MAANTIVLVESQITPLRRRLLRATVIIPVGVVIVLLVTGVFVYHHYDQKVRAERQLTDFNTAVHTAQTNLNANNNRQAIETLNSVTNDAHSASQKTTLYTDLATASANEEEYNQAIAYIKQLNQLVPSTIQSDAYMLAMYYQDLGNKTEAISYYKAAVAYAQQTHQAPTSSSGSFLGISSDASYYEAQVQALEGQ